MWTFFIRLSSDLSFLVHTILVCGVRRYDDTSGTVAAGEVRCQLHFDLGVYYFMLGDLTRAAPYLTRALDLYDAKWAGEPAHDSLRYVSTAVLIVHPLLLPAHRCALAFTRSIP